MAHKLIIDSGSTKTDWALISEHGDLRFSTKGINPSANPMLFELKEEPEDLLNYAESVESIHYYGAGVIDDRTRSIIQTWLNKYFKNVNSYEIKGDMLGAAKATAGNKKGIICILGTGSNSCVYDGKKIVDNIPALGFILSNEGGGSKIGAELIKAYFYKLMPLEVRIAFEEKYKIDKSKLIKSLYGVNDPTTYLASFSRFLSENVPLDWKESFLNSVFQEFIDIRIKQYSEYLSYDIHFVGSIAYFYANILRDVLQLNGLTCASIRQKPIDGLVDYYK